MSGTSTSGSYNIYNVTLGTSGNSGTIGTMVKSPTYIGITAPNSDDGILGDGSSDTTFTLGTTKYIYCGWCSYTVGGETLNAALVKYATGGSHYFALVPTNQAAPTSNLSISVTQDSISSTSWWNLTGESPYVLPCFVAGTLIATPAGARAVETLQAGDLVLTAEGAVMPVRWLGRSVVSRVFADPNRVLPIRIKAGALGVSLPERDLLLSPCHAVLLDGVLVQAAALVNGTTVVRDDSVASTFTYYHLELDTHAVLLAEGAAVESFLEGADNLAFANWDERVAPAAVRELEYPRVKAQRQLPLAVRERLAARAAALMGDVVLAA